MTIIVSHGYVLSVIDSLQDNRIPYSYKGYDDTGVYLKLECIPSTAEVFCYNWSDALTEVCDVL